LGELGSDLVAEEGGDVFGFDSEDGLPGKLFIEGFQDGLRAELPHRDRPRPPLLPGAGSGESQIGDIGRGSGRRSYHQQPWLSSLSGVPQARCARNPRRCQVRPECLARVRARALLDGKCS
jgi:hypothetical protein